MPNLLEVLNKTSDYLRDKGVENFKLDSQLLLASALKMNRLDLYLNFDKPLGEEDLTLCRSLVGRRGKREPLQHIVGTVQFRNLDLKIDSRALIPRKETELLVDEVIQVIQQWKKEHGADPEILEVGVGSGAILLSLLSESPECSIEGVELSPEAMEIALENAKRCGIEVNGKLHRGNLFEPFEIQKSWDIIVSNPPYVGESEWKTLQPEVLNWDPKLALVGGDSGHEFAAQLIESSNSRIRPGGKLILEFGLGQGERLSKIGLEAGWKNSSLYKDYSGTERFLRLDK